VVLAFVQCHGSITPRASPTIGNAIRSEDEALEVIEVLNPRIDPQDLAGKFIVLDILAKDRHGRRINVEMQVKTFDPWSARSTYYLASALVKQIGIGESYADLKPVIGKQEALTLMVASGIAEVQARAILGL